jgi:16S rRNA (cytidine1402-2'-O)-methyltransferase
MNSLRRQLRKARKQETPATERSGILYVVALPIGNRNDLSPRALSTLKGVSTIAAEDPATLRKILGLRTLTTTITSYPSEHLENKAEVLLFQLKQGHDVALVVDAGTPGIADPGSRLIHRCFEAGIRVSPIPGPCAITAILSISGLQGDRFTFLGQMPSSSHQRKGFHSTIIHATTTMVFFISGKQVNPLLQQLLPDLADRLVVIAVDVSKPTERLYRGRANHLPVQALPNITDRSEVTVAIQGVRLIKKRHSKKAVHTH